MIPKLIKADRKAVDLVLDRARHSDQFSEPLSLNVSERTRGVEHVLGLLGQLPDADPPADLVSRTLARISAEAQVRVGTPQVEIISSALLGQHQRPA